MRGYITFVLSTYFCRLTINEEADPSVREDFGNFIDHLIPEN